jgi:group I intron endonuclease
MGTYGYIYITTNLVNGNRYIGQHKSVDWDSNYIGSGKLLHYAIKKYGIENFTCFPIAWAWNKKELNNLEIDYIVHYKPEYNISQGGNGGNLGEEVNKLISEKCKGEKNGMFGKTHSEEIKKKLSEYHKLLKGEKAPHFGCKHSEETKEKIRESKKHLTIEQRKKISESHKGIIPSEETRKKMSLSHKGKIGPNKGKLLSNETKNKISISSFGRHWYTNGNINIKTFKCLEGFYPGQIRKNKAA